MNKLAKIIEGLGEEDLLKIKRDLIAGNIDRLVEQKLHKYHEIEYSEKQCPVCSGEITSNSFILEFGEPFLRRRAFFDAVDCLEYFVATNFKEKEKSKDNEREL
jgi:hypothetical protein